MHPLINIPQRPVPQKKEEQDKTEGYQGKDKNIFLITIFPFIFLRIE
jgi:hypothetical protein